MDINEQVLKVCRLKDHYPKSGYLCMLPLDKMKMKKKSLGIKRNKMLRKEAGRYVNGLHSEP